MTTILNTVVTNTVLTPNPPTTATAWWGWCPRCASMFGSHRLDCEAIGDVVAVPTAWEVRAPR